MHLVLGHNGFTETIPETKSINARLMARIYGREIIVHFNLYNIA